ALLRCVSNSLISAPAANASWPAPRKTTTRTCEFSLTSTNRRCKWFHMSKVMALRRSGRLNVMVAIGPSISKSSGAAMCSPVKYPFWGRGAILLGPFFAYGARLCAAFHFPLLQGGLRRDSPGFGLVPASLNPPYPPLCKRGGRGEGAMGSFRWCDYALDS